MNIDQILSAVISSEDREPSVQEQMEGNIQERLGAVREDSPLLDFLTDDQIKMREAAINAQKAELNVQKSAKKFADSKTKQQQVEESNYQLMQEEAARQQAEVGSYADGRMQEYAPSQEVTPADLEILQSQI